MTHFQGALILALSFIIAAPEALVGQDATAKQRDELAERIKKVETAYAEVSQSILRLIDDYGAHVVSREKVIAELTSLEDQLWSAQLDEEQTTIRKELLLDRLSKLSAEAKARSSKDEIARLLEQKLKLAQAKKERVEGMIKRGAVSSAELDNAEEQITDAQLELARYREAAKQSPDAEEIRELSTELAQIEIASAVKKRLRTRYEERIAQYKRALLRTGDYADLQEQEEALRRSRSELLTRLRYLEAGTAEPAAPGAPPEKK
jgi:hypothetical protein